MCRASLFPSKELCTDSHMCCMAYTYFAFSAPRMHFSACKSTPQPASTWAVCPACSGDFRPNVHVQSLCSNLLTWPSSPHWLFKIWRWKWEHVQGYLGICQPQTCFRLLPEGVLLVHVLYRLSAANTHFHPLQFWWWLEKAPQNPRLVAQWSKCFWWSHIVI